MANGNTHEREGSPNSPDREAFHQLMRDLLEVTEPTIREDMQDRADTTEALGVRTAQAWQKFTQTPWNVPRHVRQMDTALRGRDLGSMRMRLGRMVLYDVIRRVSMGVDAVDAPVNVLLEQFPGGGFASAGIEFITDELIRAGTNWADQQVTDTKSAHYASPIAVATAMVYYDYGYQER